jgi:hypothetical protein
MGTTQATSSGGAKITAVCVIDVPTIAATIAETHTYTIANGIAQLTILTIFAWHLLNSPLPYHKKLQPITHTINAVMANKLATWALTPPKIEDMSA